MTDTSQDALLKQAFEHASSGMLAVDARGTIVLVNREAARLFGYAPGELVGRPVELLIPVRGRDAHAAHRETFARASESRGRLKILRKPQTGGELVAAVRALLEET